ncbi:hypothetical protein FRC12_021194 [Ceratobasidium sp. 428]|nr:hypothetical protein FRC12_021194 [Ceratobasidium sp. 428]
MAFNSSGRQSTLNEWNNRPDAEKIFALRAKLEEYKSNTATVERAQPPRTIELSSNEQSHAARTKDADGGSKLKITATTPLSVVMDIFNSFAKINDYTSELQVESNNTVDPVAYGGYSDVYRATLRKGTHVAVKCMRSSVTGDYNAAKRTARELDTWSQLRHQNILELLGMAIFRGQLAMVSLWMDRGNVVAMVNSETNVDRFGLSTQVVSAVVFIHKQEIVHGDLKGANILVATDGTPKITDFGLAVIRDGVFDYSATNGGGGTTRWMAPELFSERATRTYQSDVYALGMTLLVSFSSYALHLILSLRFNRRYLLGRSHFITSRTCN